MGFLSFNETYYAESLKRLEGRALNAGELYEVKQLLKLSDDLLDEGYFALSHVLEEKYGALSRLREILKAHHELPFPVKRPMCSGVRYSDREVEIETVVHQLEQRVKNGITPSNDPFLADLRDYCGWIGSRPHTAYIFLLRDAFLPYLYFKSMGKDALYPWVINRDFLWQTAGKGVDDLLRLPVYEALESGISEYRDFSAFCEARIRETLRGYPALERTLRELLRGIPEENILVIESGYCGTIPLTLAALDARVEFRLYTTAPFLYETYRDHIFCRRYEQIRSFETLYAQDALIRYSSFRNGHFYVRSAADHEIWEKAAGEAAVLRSGRNAAGKTL